MVPRALLKDVVGQGLAAPDMRWEALAGGRTNRVWRIGEGADARICKLYQPSGENPLYPNLPGVEYEVLKTLARHAIAPLPVALLNTGAGEALIYRHLEGVPWRQDTREVARLLKRLHAIPPSLPLRILESGSAALTRQIRGIVARLDGAFADLDPVALPDPVPPVAAPALVHTDVVPGNIVVTPKGLRLIDWQCPGLGDPAEDLASFLSPAMQYLYTGAILSPPDAETFLDENRDTRSVRRYQMLKPLFHQRIAAYCRWQAARGRREYAHAAMLETLAVRASARGLTRRS